MELLKFFLKDDVPAVGLTKFKDREPEEEKTPSHVPQRLNLNRRAFKMSYSSNMYIM